MILDYPCEMCVSVFMRLHEKKRVGGRKGKREGGKRKMENRGESLHYAAVGVPQQCARCLVRAVNNSDISKTVPSEAHISSYHPYQ